MSGPALFSSSDVSFSCFCSSDLQEDVRSEAEGAAETVRQTREEAEGAEGWRKVHQAGCECPHQLGVCEKLSLTDSFQNLSDLKLFKECKISFHPSFLLKSEVWV